MNKTKGKTIEVDCKLCSHCYGDGCDKYGRDADYATARCAKDNFKFYRKEKRREAMNWKEK